MGHLPWASFVKPGDPVVEMKLWNKKKHITSVCTYANNIASLRTRALHFSGSTKTKYMFIFEIDESE